MNALLKKNDIGCPFCGLLPLPPSVLACPTCKNDLLNFRLAQAETVEQKYEILLLQRLKTDGKHQLEKKSLQNDIAQAKDGRAKIWWSLLALPLLLLVCRNAPPPVSKQKMAQKDSTIAQLTHRLDSLEHRKVIYILQKGDRLSDLGMRFFHHLDSGYRIGRENGILSPEQWTHLKQGDTLRISL
jgi:uncharacterized protein YbaR (Trm112 family)